MAYEWWRKGEVPKIAKGDEEMLQRMVPRPGTPLGHKLPYVPGIGDEWQIVEEIARDGGGEIVIVEMTCPGCGIKTRRPAYRRLFDPYIKWLCGDCLDSGFDWTSQVPMWASLGYQIVKTYKDDTLIRKLSNSPNPHDPVHRPMDASEMAKSLERKPRPKLEDL